jgi:hypothetical protein
MATLVKFRKDKPNQGNPDFNFENYITAVFPQLKWNKRLYGNEMLTAYAHLGQHTGACIEWVNECTDPANESEYQPLLRELESIGYNLKICK